MKNIIDFFVAVGPFLFQFLGLAVGLLQLLQSAPFTTNTGFIKSLIDKLGSKIIPKTPELWENVSSGD